MKIRDTHEQALEKIKKARENYQNANRKPINNNTETTK